MSTIFENKCPPHKIKTSGSIIYGSQRLNLALHVINILNELFLKSTSGSYWENIFILSSKF